MPTSGDEKEQQTKKAAYVALPAATATATTTAVAGPSNTTATAAAAAGTATATATVTECLQEINVSNANVVGPHPLFSIVQSINSLSEAVGRNTGQQLKDLRVQQQMVQQQQQVQQQMVQQQQQQQQQIQIMACVHIQEQQQQQIQGLQQEVERLRRQDPQQETSTGVRVFKMCQTARGGGPGQIRTGSAGVENGSSDHGDGVVPAPGP